jgi:NAD(P)-dependent dehydrogenase (short-subunit alcohol dehydrogenase family)
MYTCSTCAACSVVAYKGMASKWLFTSLQKLRCMIDSLASDHFNNCSCCKLSRGLALSFTRVCAPALLAGQLDYAATKGAIMSFTRSLATQLLPKGQWTAHMHSSKQR